MKKIEDILGSTQQEAIVGSTEDEEIVGFTQDEKIIGSTQDEEAGTLGRQRGGNCRLYALASHIGRTEESWGGRALARKGSQPQAAGDRRGGRLALFPETHT